MRGVELGGKWARFKEETRELRRRLADWEFIRSQPPRIRAALELYVETGDVRLACRISGLKLEAFVRLSKKAGIPTGL
ncbi:MAG: hypothetical protein DRN99_07380 [Thermoproteota archaeon]|nr:MAG: hypothetical protein DRN99_07380 [Candidatus Korarchaeota archaeon]